MQRAAKFVIGGAGGAAVFLAAFVAVSAVFATPGCTCGGGAANMNWDRMTLVEKVLYRWNGSLPEDVIAGTRP
ncbi:hypothetical protein [Tabrizicola sp.]|uniref:hypothetical protein n=1 Tax=Tabrizicola sp. TaxID=2005166 RepID=UPI003F392286